LPVGKTYYWSVQAVDGAFAGSPFSSESAFTLIGLTPPSPPFEVGPRMVGNGTFEFYFTNNSSFYFHVLGSTNLVNWTVLGGVTEISPGVFHFTDPAAGTFQQRFYRLSWP
jgi:hypothetical protein